MGSSAPSGIAILGPGLLGGSVALAMRKAFPAAQIRFYGRRREVLDQLDRTGVADFVTGDPAEAVTGVDLVVLTTPVEVMATVLQAAAPGLGDGVVVTDVGSVKGDVVTELTGIAEGAGTCFVSSHPMAGSESGGLDNARADLFQGAACLVTPLEGGAPEPIAKVVNFWESLGCHVSVMSPERHDQVVGKISHLPHAVASAVVGVALSDDPDIAAFIGGGFRDTTRIAAGDPDLWTGILMANREVMDGLLKDAGDRLHELSRALEDGDATTVRQFLDRAKKLRQTCPRIPENEA